MERKRLPRVAATAAGFLPYRLSKENQVRIWLGHMDGHVCLRREVGRVDSRGLWTRWRRVGENF
jgi:hypothetical protein